MFSESPDLLKEMNANLFAIRKLMEIQNREAVTRELERLASTPERRKMWVLCTGEINTEQIAKKVGVSDRSVQYFVKDGTRVGMLATRKRGYPIRTIEFVPQNWAEVEALETQNETAAKQSQTSAQETAERPSAPQVQPNQSTIEGNVNEPSQKP